MRLPARGARPQKWSVGKGPRGISQPVAVSLMRAAGRTNLLIRESVRFTVSWLS